MDVELWDEITNPQNPWTNVNGFSVKLLLKLGHHCEIRIHMNDLRLFLIQDLILAIFC